MKANLALGSAPAVPSPSFAAGVTSPTSLLSVFLHHRPKRIDARGQAEPIEACRHLVPSFAHSPHIRRKQYSRCCANSFHGVAFLSWNQYPKPIGSRRATLLLLFQHRAGQLLVNPPAFAQTGTNEAGTKEADSKETGANETDLFQSRIKAAASNF